MDTADTPCAATPEATSRAPAPPADRPPLRSWPPVFLSHGSPMIALQPGAAGRFMAQLGRSLLQTLGPPRAVIVFSAHTLAHHTTVLAAPHHAAVYDFGGFDPALYRLRYDAPGAPEWAQAVQQALAAKEQTAAIATQGGLDHGIWTALRHVLPQADVPVLPVAWTPDASPASLMATGAALADLAARENLWVLGTGSITHNLQRVFARGLDRVEQPDTPESLAFRDWFAARAAAADWPALQDYRRRAPHAVLMHPTDEHLLPWFIAAGAGGPAHPAVRLHASQTHGDLGMDAYAFGPQAAALEPLLAAAGQA
jgi:4,5-DOPA dioxygenase extradiol